MNTIYRIVWNVATGKWVVASELAKGRKKKSTRSMASVIALTAAVAGVGFTGYASAQTLGNNVTQGNSGNVVLGDNAAGSIACTQDNSVPTAACAVVMGNTATAATGNTVVIGDHASTTANGSVAIGSYATADKYSQAIGSGANASGGWATAIGQGALANSTNTTAIGTNATAIANGAVAVGSGAHANQQASFALGWNANANSTGAMAFGQSVTATGTNAIGLGTNSAVNGNYSIAMGSGAKTSADNTIAIGDGASSTASNALALGANTVADRANTVSVGSDATDGTGFTSQIVNVAAGVQSTDAVNVSQLTPVVNALGGGSSINSTTGAVTGPTYTINGNSYNNVGSALTAANRYFKADGLNNGSDDAQVTAGTNSVAIGAGASATGDNSVALGADSTATRDNVVSVGYGLLGNGTRQIINVANGTEGTDAVNVNQLTGAVASLGGGAGISTTTGVVTGPTYNVQGGTQTTVAQALDALDTGVNTNATNINNLANNISNGTVGLVQQAAPGADLTVGKDTDGTAVDFADKNGNTRTLSNVGAGVADTDAVNVSQLKSSGLVDSNGNAIAAVTYDQNADGTPNYGSVTMAGPVSTDGGMTGGTKITNVAQGNLSATSTDAVNGAQLYATNQQVSQNTTDISNLQTNVSKTSRYFKANGLNNGTDDALAGGPNDIAIGHNAVAKGGANGGVIAIGAGATAGSPWDYSSAATATVIGTNATGTIWSTVLGAGARANQSSTAMGSGAATAGLYATAMGDEASAAGDASAAVGTQARASAVYATALGYRADAVGVYATALGSSASAAGYGGTAMGASANASNTYSTAIGNQAAAAGYGGTATGVLAKASGKYTAALGATATAAGDYGTALGAGASVTGSATNSVALGALSVADRINSVSVGSAGKERQITNVAAGTEDTDAVNVGQLTSTLANSGLVDSNGNVMDAVVYDPGSNRGQVTLGGVGATAPVTLTNVANGVKTYDAVNFGQLSGLQNNLQNQINTVNTQVSSLDGRVTNIENNGGGTGTPGYLDGTGSSTGTNSNANAGDTAGVALGYNAAATGDNASAVGQNAQALGSYGLATGNDSYAAGANDTAIGGNAQVHADGSTAVGANSTVAASATNAVAVGADSAVNASSGTAVGQAAAVNASSGTAVGQGASVASSATNSVALGAGSVASQANSVSVGSAGNERTITNVAAGVNATDAVNVSQLQSSQNWAQSYVDQKASQLNSRITAVGRHADAGTAGAIAMTNIPQAYQPNQSSVGAGVGTFNGQAAVAVGMSTITPNGRWVLKGSLTGTTQGDVGVGFGASMVW